MSNIWFCKYEETTKERLINGDNYISICIYEDKNDFDNGKDNGVYVIEKMEVK